MSESSSQCPHLLRARAIGMLEAGKSQGEVARTLGKTTRTINNWWKRHKLNVSLQDNPRSVRPSSIKRVAKIVISKYLGKRRQSTRNIAKRLTAQGHPTSKTAIHGYLKNTLKVRSFKRPQCPRSQKQKIHRLKFCKDRISWSSEQWENVIFSDEAPFYLCEHLTDRSIEFGAQMAKISRLSSLSSFPRICSILIHGSRTLRMCRVVSGRPFGPAAHT